MGIGIVGTGLLAYYGFLKDSTYLENAPALVTTTAAARPFTYAPPARLEGSTRRSIAFLSSFFLTVTSAS